MLKASSRIALLGLLLATLAAAQSPSERAVTISQQEWERFGRQTMDKNGEVVREGGKEYEDGFSERVGEYWQQGVDLPYSGKDTEVPWSAAFISWLHKEAGFGERFRYSPLHATYIRDSILARKSEDPDAAYWGYRLSERAPQVGDLVGYARQGGITFDYQPSRYFSHTDLVVAVRPNEIDVIGGNVRDSVTLKTLSTDEQGLLIDKNQRWFVVMAPNPKVK